MKTIIKIIKKYSSLAKLCSVQEAILIRALSSIGIKIKLLATKKSFKTGVLSG